MPGKTERLKGIQNAYSTLRAACHFPRRLVLSRLKFSKEILESEIDALKTSLNSTFTDSCHCQEIRCSRSLIDANGTIVSCGEYNSIDIRLLRG